MAAILLLTGQGTKNQAALAADLSPATAKASASAPAPALAPITAPPASLRLDPFYKKHLLAGGVAIVGSDKVSDFALREAAFLVDRLLEHRPDVREAMARAGARVAVMAYNEFTTDLPEHSRLTPKDFWNRRARGLGGTRHCPVTSCGEENLLNYRGDPYPTENIFIHEFGHTILDLGLDRAFRDRLDKAYRQALADGKWKGTYAANNLAEYWAEGVQSWFDTNRSADAIHNGVNTREKLQAYDAGLSGLLAEVFGEKAWRYRRLADRAAADRPHLAGYDPAAAPRFTGPPREVRTDAAPSSASRPSPRKESKRP